MAILNRMKMAKNTHKARNEKCQCNSGLKFKHCHGDPQKQKVANVVANLAMSVMIHHRCHKAGLITEDQCDEVVGKIQEMIYNVLDPDYTPPEPTKTEIVESEDRQREKEEEAEPEPEEMTGQKKIESIRESAGVARCPKCLGVMMVGEEMCYKCKKGQ